MNKSAQQAASDEAEKADAEQLNKVIKRFGGRHLIFRTKSGGWWMTPRPYVLVSSFRGPVWMFYGAGQIWITHKKLRDIGGWMARVPRIANKKILQIVDSLDSDIAKFTGFCNEHGIEGTLVIDRQAIEFHWTFGDQLQQEKLKNDNAAPLDDQFKALCDRYREAKNKFND